MAKGTTYSTLLFQEIACFNGGLFENSTALPLSKDQLAMLLDAAGTDWSAVEPSIFGTLLTRALDPRERHKLGAHYTPRSYVERLVRPTIIDPLREQWDAIRIAAASLHREADLADEEADSHDVSGKTLLAAGKIAAAKKAGSSAVKLRAEAKKKDAEALKLVTDYHRELCKLTVLDPACGTANFLYVTLELLKRLEAEVLELVTALGGDATFEMTEYKVRPEQFLGLELSHHAVAIAQLVLWIGYFQWQRKTTGKADTGDRPLLPKDRSIRQQDAVLTYDSEIPRRDPETGKMLTIWDGHTTKPHPVTGKEVPDESATIVLKDYENPKRAEWPQADFIVGNPPFIGAKRMKEALGDGYTSALQSVWSGDVPGGADFVFYWWKKASDLVALGKAKRFGFITTNSLTQSTARKVTEEFLTNKKNAGSLVFAIPDHPWVDSSDGAAVRIAMTVGASRKVDGVLGNVISELPTNDGEVEVTIRETRGTIASNLTLGVDVTQSTRLKSNANVCWQGCKLVGSGFQISPEEADRIGHSGLNGAKVLKSYWAGNDLAQLRQPRFVIDFFGFSEEAAKEVHPSAFQHLAISVLPERAQNRDRGFREKWWIFGRPRPDLRRACEKLDRYIVTSEVSKHRCFIFLQWPDDLIDGSIMAIASSDGSYLSLLSSIVHTAWASAAGGRMGIGNDLRYQSGACFAPFPFPALEEGEFKSRLRDLGERLDSHRKRRQALHPALTLTGLYNVLTSLRRGEALSAKEKVIHDDGLVTLLKQLHDEIDAAVLEAYGWSDLAPATMPFADLIACGGPEAEALEQKLLTRLVALNHERAAEEKRGLIRWLRPEYQNPAAANNEETRQATLDGLEDQSDVKARSDWTERSEVKLSSPAPESWPAKLPEQVALIKKLVAVHGTEPAALSAAFGKTSKKRHEQIEGILETLRGLGLL